MGAVLRKFVSRAPRYVLQTSDNQVMRYSTNSSAGAVFKTSLINISETGAAFIVDQSMSIKIGENLKVELPIPGHDQIAWFGRVVRMEAYENLGWWSAPDPFVDSEKLLIGIHFEGLPEIHRKAINKGIEQRMLQALKERRKRQQMYLSLWLYDHALKAVGYAILTALSFFILYYLSLPNDNYNADRGAPWGQRFQFFDFEKKSR